MNRRSRIHTMRIKFRGYDPDDLALQHTVSTDFRDLKQTMKLVGRSATCAIPTQSRGLDQSLQETGARGA
jgi:hypothetical protein